MPVYSGRNMLSFRLSEFDPELPWAAAGVLQCTHTVYMHESQYGIYGVPL